MERENTVKRNGLFDHCEIMEGTGDVDVLVLHEFATTAASMRPVSKHFNERGYTVLNCEYPAHGSRMNETFSWEKTIDELEAIMKARKNETILVGSSAGGSLAITLGSRNPGVSKVFAISTPNQPSGYAWLGGSWMAREEARILPSRTARCVPSNKDRFFLIHARNDSLVPLSELERNKDALCLPDENVLVVDKVTGIGIIDHFLLKNNEKVLDFIAHKANESR